jgi:hypothetical protein
MSDKQEDGKLYLTDNPVKPQSGDLVILVRDTGTEEMRVIVSINDIDGLDEGKLEMLTMIGFGVSRLISTDPGLVLRKAYETIKEDYGHLISEDEAELLDAEVQDLLNEVEEMRTAQDEDEGVYNLRSTTKCQGNA